MTGKTFRARFEHPRTAERREAVVRDITLGGMFVETDSPADVGALVTVEIDLRGVKVSVDGRVLRRESDGMAMTFLDLPDDVAATLMAAVTPSSSRTILGVGGASVKATTPGIPAPETPRTPASVPSVKTTTPGIAAAPVAPKPSAPEKRAEKRAEKPVETRAEEEPPPPRKRGSGARWFMLLLFGAGAAAAWEYREPLRRGMHDAIGPAPTPAPTRSAIYVEPVPSLDAGARDE